MQLNVDICEEHTRMMNSDLFQKTEPDILQDVSNTKEETDTYKSDLCSSREESERRTQTTSSEVGLGRPGLLRGMMNTCFKPFCGIFVRKEKIKRELWRIPFNELTEITLVGSGAQGAVFLGHYKNQEVAIKKVRNEKDTEIKHLRHLDHRNIVKFRYSRQFC